jgi:hypothetical protein
MVCGRLGGGPGWRSVAPLPARFVCPPSPTHRASLLPASRSNTPPTCCGPPPPRPVRLLVPQCGWKSSGTDDSSDKRSPPRSPDRSYRRSRIRRRGPNRPPLPAASPCRRSPGGVVMIGAPSRVRGDRAPARPGRGRSGGLLVIGAAGSGRTTLADAAAGLGRRRGFDVAAPLIMALTWDDVLNQDLHCVHCGQCYTRGVLALEFEGVSNRRCRRLAPQLHLTAEHRALRENGRAYSAPAPVRDAIVESRRCTRLCAAAMTRRRS